MKILQLNGPLRSDGDFLMIIWSDDKKK